MVLRQSSESRTYLFGKVTDTHNHQKWYLYVHIFEAGGFWNLA